jgi:hypothetical protein
MFWENMDITLTERIYRIILVFLSTLALIVGSFFIIYGLNLKKMDLDSSTDKVIQITTKNKLRALSIMIAIVIIIINNILKGVVRYLTLNERHETHTAQTLSIAMKLALARFVNTALLPCIVNNQYNRWFTDGGLVSDTFAIMISVSFLDPVLMLMDPVFIV